MPQNDAETNLLLIGATGYIGGGVLSRLLGDGRSATFHVTTLLRNQQKARDLEPFGVHAVVGSLDNTDLLTHLAKESDIVIECADADHLQSTKAILAGLKERHKATGKVPSLIHTSGTGVLVDNAAGMFSTDTVYYDDDLEQLDKISPDQPHREVDLIVIDADKEGYVNAYLILPSTIYGLANGPLVDAGIMNPQSQQIPALILASLSRKRAGMIGEGKNIWNNVQIDDIVHLYEVIWDAILTGKKIGHGKEGYYFGENGEHRLHDVGKAIGKALKELRIAETDEPSTFTKEELDLFFSGSESLGTNSRCRGRRARAIGWNPKKTTEDMLASVKPEVQYMLTRD
ncbi:NAD-P-binding protein [Lentinus tigrinus ALCF2SS1-7]|uniref:NAD-P-binding protein n=1 Tax=Lentinus tigrinus ALCF2SS1-7 TaxID=1328758 RepID=UPI001166322F|nr:NAD-P-binding protein [Lentinus tigrinus ALCF2SS1-7]